MTPKSIVRACGYLAAVVAVSASPRATPAARAAQKRPAGGQSLSWDRVPKCLDATVGRDAGGRTTGAIVWRSERHEMKTPAGVFTMRVHDYLVGLTLDGQPVQAGADLEGKPIDLEDWALAVWAMPDCAQPAYGFVEQTSHDANPEGRRWLFDARTKNAAGAGGLVEFPGRFGPDTSVAFRGGALTVTNDAGGLDEHAYLYVAEPIPIFVQRGAKDKYLKAIGKPTDVFFADASASQIVLAGVGREAFDDLRASTAVGSARLFEGRYLIVSGAASGDYQRHGALVIDVVRDALFTVVCTDHQEETGALTAAYGPRAASLEGGGDRVLAAFQLAGFYLRWDETTGLACDGPCHEER